MRPAPRVGDLLAEQEHTLPLVEQFGATLQGEGPAAGRAAWFVRFGGCDLSCTWCDSAYTWDGGRYDLRSEITPTPVRDIAARIPAGTLVILTGGEPLLHQDRAAWETLLNQLAGRELHVETNGTRLPNLVTAGTIDTFVVSPKLGNAGPHRGKQDPTLHTGWTEMAGELNAHLKVVCADDSDVEQAVQLADDYGWPRRRVWVMPLGTTRRELAGRWPIIAEAATRHGINATHRLHVLAWGDKRGH